MCCQSFIFSHSRGCLVVFHCDFNSNLSGDQWLGGLPGCLLTSCVSSSQNVYFSLLSFLPACGILIHFLSTLWGEEIFHSNKVYFLRVLLSVHCVQNLCLITDWKVTLPEFYSKTILILAFLHFLLWIHYTLQWVVDTQQMLFLCQLLLMYHTNSNSFARNWLPISLSHSYSRGKELNKYYIWVRV